MIQGILIEYLDGGEANDPRHVGYITWTPADVFRRALSTDRGTGLSFGLAIEAMKIGKRGWPCLVGTARACTSITFQPIAYPPTTVAGREIADKTRMASFNYAAYIAMKTVQRMKWCRGWPVRLTCPG
jgi:hypothetical protein